MAEEELPDPAGLQNPSLLVVVLDLHPLSWHLLSLPPDAAHVEAADAAAGVVTARAPLAPLLLEDFVTVLLVFLSAHLASRFGNRVVVFGASGRGAQMLYPTPDTTEIDRPRPNMYAPFEGLHKTLEARLRGVMADEQADAERDPAKLNEPPAIVSALTKALCYINRLSPDSSSLTSAVAGTSHQPDRLEKRIMVINATPGSSTSTSANGEAGNDAKKARASGGMRGGYVGLMNCVFAAQKAKVPIDVLSLPPQGNGTAQPIFLQQASYLTDGIYWRWNGRGGLLQYLHTIFLIPPSLRKTSFAVPPQDALDFRAVCFCHHDVVEIGFVCSVCLSIFCKPVAICQMCKTRFPVKAMSALRKLADGIESIPIPQTVVEPVEPPNKKKRGSITRNQDSRGDEVAE